MYRHYQPAQFALRMRRYTRLLNGSLESYRESRGGMALNYFAYNFIKIHRTLRMSPAMAAGVTDRLWDVNDLVTLWKPTSGVRKDR